MDNLPEVVSREIRLVFSEQLEMVVEGQRVVYDKYTPSSDFLAIYMHEFEEGYIKIANDYGTAALKMEELKEDDELMRLLDNYSMKGLFIEYYCESSTIKDFNDYLLMGIISLLEESLCHADLKSILHMIGRSDLFPKLLSSLLDSCIIHISERILYD